MIRQVRVHRQDTRVVPPLDIALRLFNRKRKADVSTLRLSGCYLGSLGLGVPR
jgi:hypothetical protein